MGEILNFTDSERFQAPKTDWVLKVYQGKEFYSRFVDLENSGLPATLSEKSCSFLNLSLDTGNWH